MYIMSFKDPMQYHTYILVYPTKYAHGLFCFSFVCNQFLLGVCDLFTRIELFHWCKITPKNKAQYTITKA